MEAYRKTGSFERVADFYDMLTPQQIKAALEYYAVYPERVDEDIETNAQAWKELTGRPWPA